MKGKDKCRLLKQIRKEIAEANDIVYLTSECTYEGECSGTCPKCDAEIRYLDNEIARKIKDGKTVTLSGLSLDTFEFSVTQQSTNNNQLIDSNNDSYEYMGDEVELVLLDELEEEGRIEPYHERRRGQLEPINIQRRIEIEELNITIKGLNALLREGIYTIDDLVEYSPKELLKLQGFGKLSLKQVIQGLEERGLSLKEDRPRYREYECEIMGMPAVEHFDNQEPETLNDLNLSARVLFSLRSAGITTLNELLNLTDDELRESKYIGPNAYKDIITQLDYYNLYLKEDSEE